MQSVLLKKSATNNNYIAFSNNKGKKWSVHKNNISTSLKLYEPMHLKGRFFKLLLPIFYKIGLLKYFLNYEENSVVLSEKLMTFLESYYGKNFEFSVFWGTPCIDSKITIQIFKNNKILGYCKVGKNNRVKNLFYLEKDKLKFLKEKNFDYAPDCLDVVPLNNNEYAFLQTTNKKKNYKTPKKFGKSHYRFLLDLFNKTNKSILFEETDFYSSLNFLQKNINLIDEKFRENVNSNLTDIMNLYANKIVNWGLVHRDFTPWNTYFNNGKLFAFDFEYALFNAPGFIDKWHFIFQTNIFKNKLNNKKLIKKVKKLKFYNSLEIKIYLLDIISLYLTRGEKEDIDIANKRAELLLMCN
ncbi:MAG: hypothetical protein IJP26_02695 [Clostridia bacterium]|nr:hypothetical protein [Clostridia bacterium]